MSKRVQAVVSVVKTVRPLMRAVGHLPGIVRDGGPKIERDVWRAAPPLAILGRLSILFPTMLVDRRGRVAAIALAVTLLAATAAGLVLWT